MHIWGAVDLLKCMGIACGLRLRDISTMSHGPRSLRVKALRRPIQTSSRWTKLPAAQGESCSAASPASDASTQHVLPLPPGIEGRHKTQVGETN